MAHCKAVDFLQNRLWPHCLHVPVESRIVCGSVVAFAVKRAEWIIRICNRLASGVVGTVLEALQQNGFTGIVQPSDAPHLVGSGVCAARASS